MQMPGSVVDKVLVCDEDKVLTHWLVTWCMASHRM
jgi:hypothetical protein